MRQLTLFCLMLLAATSGHAQMKTFKDYTDSSRYLMYAAGAELIQFNREFKTGIVCSISGLALTGIGIAIQSSGSTTTTSRGKTTAKSDNSNAAAMFYIGGGILEFLGVYFTIGSFGRAKNAGLHLQGKTIAIDL